MAWSHAFLFVSTLGHAALLGGVAFLPKSQATGAEPDTELFFIDAPEVVEEPAPAAPPEPEAPAAPPPPSPVAVAPAPIVKPPPTSAEPVSEDPPKAEAASDNPYDNPELVAANTQASANTFAMRSGHGTELRPQPPPPRAAPKPVRPPPPQVDVMALFKSWRARVGNLVISAAGRRYPDSARRLGNEGTVVLSMSVDSHGRVTLVQLVRSSGHDDLDQAALTTVRGLGAVPPPPLELHATLRPFAVPIAYRLQ